MTQGQQDTTTAIPGYQAGTWEIDSAHSEIGFSVRHLMVSKVRGRFAEFTGTIVTAADIADSTVSVDIELASIATGNEQRDAHLRSKDFFEADTYPTMTYRSTDIVADGDNFVLRGKLSLNGITKAVPVKFEVVGAGPDAYGGYRIGFSGNAEINRQDFNVEFNQLIEGGGVVVGDKITVQLEVEAVRQDS